MSEPLAYPTRKSHPLYATYYSMIGRCHNPEHPDYPTYGARGIAVCERWRNSFAQFVFDVGPRQEGMTLDRIDNEKGYFTANVRWASRKDQALNRRGTRLIAYQGRPLTVGAIAAEVGMNAATLGSRLAKGMTLEEAIQQPVDARFQPWYKSPS